MATSVTPQPPVVNDLTTSELHSAISQAASSPLRTTSTPTTLEDITLPNERHFDIMLPRPNNPTPFGQAYLLDPFSPSHLGFSAGRPITSLIPPRLTTSASASSVELLVPGSSRSPLMNQVFDSQYLDALSSELNTPADDLPSHLPRRITPAPLLPPHVPTPAPQLPSTIHHRKHSRKLKSLQPLVIKQLPESPSVTASSPVVPPSVPALPSIPHNPTYYLRDDMVIFEVNPRPIIPCSAQLKL